jgi:hypothetical protein
VKTRTQTLKPQTLAQVLDGLIASLAKEVPGQENNDALRKVCSMLHSHDDRLSLSLSLSLSLAPNNYIRSLLGKNQISQPSTLEPQTIFS